MKKCEKCGFTTENSEMNFCMNCGAPFEDQKVDLSKKAAPIREVFPEKSAEEIYPAERNKTSVPENTHNTLDYTVPAASKKSNGGIIASCAMVAAFIVVAVLVVALPHNKEDKLVSEEISDTVISSEITEELTETMTMTTMTETFAEKAAETTAATTKPTETTITETEADEDEVYYGDERPTYFSFSGGSISLNEKNSFYKFNKEDEYDHEFYTGYYTYIPSVSMNTNNEAAKKIENALNDAFQISLQNGEDTNENVSVLNYEPQFGYGSMTFERWIKNVIEENGLLFVTVANSEYGGGLTVYNSEQTLIFDIATGNEYFLENFVTDRSAFLEAVNDYILDDVAACYSSGEYDGYPIFVEYDYFEEEMKKNPWFTENCDWDYDGEELTILYFYLLANGTSSFSVPKYVWSAYVDFSPNAKADYSEVDSLGKKIMSGNTAGNYCNYSAYCFDSENIYFAGGVDGYNWRPYKAYIGGSYEYGTELSEDMTDSVIVDGNTVYYRNANDDYKLYSVGTDGLGRKKVTDYKVSSFRLYDGKIYFTADNALYRINKDGTEKTKIINKSCYDLQIYDDYIFTISANASGVEFYDISGNYMGIFSPMFYPVKQFFVSDGYCVILAEGGLSLIDIRTGYEVYYNDMNGISINEDKDNFLIALYDDYGGECLYRIPKNDVSNSYYVDNISFNGREFYVVYTDYVTYIYTLNKDGAASCRSIYY